MMLYLLSYKRPNIFLFPSVTKFCPNACCAAFVKLNSFCGSKKRLDLKSTADLGDKFEVILSAFLYEVINTNRKSQLYFLLWTWKSNPFVCAMLFWGVMLVIGESDL